MMALSGDQNPDFKVITKGSSKVAIENQPIKAIFSETQKKLREERVISAKENEK